MSAPADQALQRSWQATCHRILLALGQPLAVPTVRLSRRMTWRLGTYRQDRHEIALSHWLAAHQPQAALETLKHELAHAVAHHHAPGCRPHGLEWREACRALGIPPERCSSLPHLGPPARPRPRYLYSCQVCGGHVLYRRRLRLPHSCGRCDRRYNPRYRLRFVGRIEPEDART